MTGIMEYPINGIQSQSIVNCSLSENDVCFEKRRAFCKCSNSPLENRYYTTLPRMMQSHYALHSKEKLVGPAMLQWLHEPKQQAAKMTHSEKMKLTNVGFEITILVVPGMSGLVEIAYLHGDLHIAP